MKYFGLLTFFFCFLCSASIEASETVHVCDDNQPWPPYTYPASPEIKNIPDHGRIGAMVDFMDAIMTDIGLDHEINLKPWSRCLKEMQNYAMHGQAEVMMGVGYNEERAAFAHFSLPVFNTIRGIFYSVDKFPEGVDWEKPEDTKDYVVCIVKGFDYSDVIKSEAVNTFETSTLAKALEQLRRGRCDVLFSSIVTVLGSKLTGTSILPDGVTFKEYSTPEFNEYHIIVSKKSPRAEMLLEHINNSIQKLTENGTQKAIFDKYYGLMKK